MDKRDKRVRKFVFLGALILFIILFIVAFFIFSTKGSREKALGLARRLFEKPVRLEMERPKKAAVPTAKAPPPEILVDDFDVGLTSGLFKGRRNRLGSYQGTWAKRPSYSIITKSSEIRRGDHGQSLVIDYKKEAGWCGWYTLLNNIDVTAYNTLSFWVKGAKGEEKFDIGLADARMQDLEIDAFFLGTVTSFIHEGFVTKEWKEVKVPLARASAELDLSKMGSLVFWFKYGGEGRIYIEDVKFKNDPAVLEMEDYNAPRAEKDSLHPRSLWVWKWDPVSNIKHRAVLFQLCEKTNISILYQFFPEFTEPPPDEYIMALAEFLREAHKRALKVEALTGNPVWSLAENHHLLLNWTKFFLDYNKDRPQEERVDGISIDVEPYLTTEWNQDRDRIKKDYLDLMRKSRELIDSYGQEFRMGVAIPFFYDKEDEGRFERSILEYVDYLALMDYYDTAKEIIERAKFHIGLANELNKKVAIGVETQDLVEMRQGKRRNTFIEEGWEEMERRLEKVRQEFLPEPSFEGFAIHCDYSYRLMTRGRNVPTKERSIKYVIMAGQKKGPVIVDGLLNEWDLSTPYEVMDKRYVVYGGGACRGTEDLCYRFYLSWDEEALYIAVDVVDDKVIQEKTAGDMWEGDHVELWLDVDLYGDLTEAVNSEDDFQIGLSPGDFQNLKPEVYVWIPELPEGVDYKGLIELGSSRTETGYIIEARVPKEVLFSTTAETRIGVEPMPPEGQQIFRLPSETPLGLYKGFRMGIMVDVGDMDDPLVPMESLISLSEERIWGDPTTFGVMELE